MFHNWSKFFKPLNESGQDFAYYESFDEMFESEKFIGFKSQRNRYLLCKSGAARGYAVASSGTWMNHSQQPLDQYYVFDTAKELYQWLAEGEE